MRAGRGLIWRVSWLAAGLLSAWVVAGPVVRGSEPARGTDELPDVVILDELEDLYAPVPFEHRLHAEMASMWNGCQTCHHRTPTGRADSAEATGAGLKPHTQAESAEVPACKSCHSLEEASGDIRMPSLSAAYHRQCLDCHRDWDHEKSCVVCHEPKTEGEASGQAPSPAEVVGRMHPPAETPKEMLYESRYVPDAGRYVTFRHDEHVKTFGFKCVECHREDTCASCHSEDGDREGRKPLKPSESWRLSHEPCLSCHDHQNCDHCHHKEPDTPPPPFEHRMTGQLLDENHDELLCRSCHGSVNFTAIPTCGDAACHTTPQVAAYPDKRPGEQLASASPGVRRQALSSVIGVAPRIGRAEETGISQSIINAPAPMAGTPDRARMTTIDRPTTISTSCVTAECHVAIKSYNVVHGPVAIDACGVCHELANEKEHRFKVTRDGKALCTYCHEFDVDAMPVVHAPARDGECLGCHNPHGGQDPSITRDVSVEVLCNRCHESVTAHQAFLHTPVEDGSCMSCHSPHASRFPMLLDAVGADLCISCHDEFGEQLGRVKFVHQAMDERCMRCHDVHGSAFPLSLVAPVPALCLDCHEDTGDRITSAPYAHDPVMDGSSCMTCHTPHGGDLASLMRDLPARLCLQCHDEGVETSDGRVIAAVNDVMSADRFKHGQIADGSCRGCHEPHGGDRPMLLAGEYPQGYYAAHDGNTFELCFKCHNEAIATQREVTIGEDAPTKFRNGPLNLHSLHVNSGLGRSCGVCHDTHTGENALLVRTTVPYQMWEAPLELTLTDTGGRCVTGCHLPFSYDRDAPVALIAQREAGEEARRIRAVSATMSDVRWRGTDIQGAAVDVPDPDHTSLLLFVRADNGEDARTIAAVRKAIPDGDDAQVVVIVSGESAASRAQALSVACDPSWRVVLEDQDLVNATHLVAHPIVVMVRPDGKELARIGGAPQSLAMKLQAYADVARMDEAASVTLETIKPTVIGRGGVDSDQYHRVARQLIAKGEPARAEKTLQEGIELYPEDGALYGELVGLWCRTGQAERALDLLNRMPGHLLDAQRSTLLRARALVTLERWDEAKGLLETLLATDPDMREAHRLMGLIYQHFDQWQEAAHSFQRALEP